MNQGHIDEMIKIIISVLVCVFVPGDLSESVLVIKVLILGFWCYMRIYLILNGRELVDDFCDL